MAATESISDSLESMEVILRYFRLRRSSGISFDFLSSSRPTVVFILRFRIVLWIADTFDLRTLRFRERISFKMPFRAFTVKYGQRELSQTQWKRTYFLSETLWEHINGVLFDFAAYSMENGKERECIQCIDSLSQLLTVSDLHSVLKALAVQRD